MHRRIQGPQPLSQASGPVFVKRLPAQHSILQSGTATLAAAAQLARPPVREPGDEAELVEVCGHGNEGGEPGQGVPGGAVGQALLSDPNRANVTYQCLLPCILTSSLGESQSIDTVVQASDTASAHAGTADLLLSSTVPLNVFIQQSHQCCCPLPQALLFCSAVTTGVCMHAGNPDAAVIDFAALVQGHCPDNSTSKEL
jgi:hypothetical protein